MDRGEIVEIGSHDELMQREGAYFRLYQAQARNVDTDLDDHGGGAPEIVKESSRMNTNDFNLTRNAAGRLVLTRAQGETFEGIVPVRAFPIGPFWKGCRDNEKGKSLQARRGTPPLRSLRIPGMASHPLTARTYLVNAARLPVQRQARFPRLWLIVLFAALHFGLLVFALYNGLVIWTGPTTPWEIFWAHALDRGPYGCRPSAWITSQSMVIWRSPSASKSTTARRLRPISRWISDRAAALLAGGRPRDRVRSSVARGSMPYSAVIQPRAWPLSQGGRRSSSTHRYQYMGIAEFHEAGAFRIFDDPALGARQARSSSGWRWLGRMGSPAADMKVLLYGISRLSLAFRFAGATAQVPSTSESG